MIVLAYCAGLRLGEIVRLKVQDIDLETASISVRDTKFFNYAAFLAMPNRPRLDHDDAGKEPAARHSQVTWIGIVLMANDP
jgi:hypothetical protein